MSEGINKIREMFPQYASIPDGQLAFAVHQNYYKEVPLGLWSAEAGLGRDIFKDMVQAAADQGVELSAATPGFRQASNEVTISQSPIMSRIATAVSAIPYAGDYIDEAVGAINPAGQAQMRRDRQAFEENRPKEAMALKLGTGLASGVAAAPLIAGSLPATLLGRVAAGAGLGALFGGTEGAVSGYGAGTTPDERVLNAQQRAISGAKWGAGLGVASPFLGAAAGKAAQYIKESPVRSIANSIGIKKDAAGLLGSIAEADAPFTAANIASGGKYGSLASTGPNATMFLDYAANMPGKNAAVAKKLVEENAANAGSDLVGTLDRTFGPPIGLESMKRDLMQSTSTGRSNAYNAAFSKPIDYASPTGQQLEQMLKRVDQSFVETANNLMRREGNASNQIIVKVAKDGTVKFSKLPDVRQIDYMTRAMNSVSHTADPLERQTRKALAGDLRTTVDQLVPEYNAARGTAGDVIAQREALDIGADFLKPNTKREDVASALRGMSPAELANVKAGIRYQLDELMANVKRSLTDPNMDAKEAAKALSDMSSKAARDKFRLLMGDADAEAFFKTIDEVYIPLSQRASVAQNAKTAIRQKVDEYAKEHVTPTFLERVTDKGVIGGAIEQAKPVLQSGAPTLAQRQREMIAEIAPVLARVKTPSQLTSEIAMMQQLNPQLQKAEDLRRMIEQMSSAGGITAAPAVTSALNPQQRLLTGRR